MQSSLRPAFRVRISPSRTRQVTLQTQTTEPIPETLRQQLARMDQKRASFVGLSAPVLESLYGSLRIELTYASNAIEGNTLSLRETQLVVEEKLTPGEGKTLREIYEARNHFAAIKEVERWVGEKREITARAILDLHQMVMRDIDAAHGKARAVRLEVTEIQISDSRQDHCRRDYSEYRGLVPHASSPDLLAASGRGLFRVPARKVHMPLVS